MEAYPDGDGGGPPDGREIPVCENCEMEERCVWCSDCDLWLCQTCYGQDEHPHANRVEPWDWEDLEDDARTPPPEVSA